MSGQTKIYIADNEELMKEWDYEANDGLNPKEITIGSHKKVWWKCHNCSYRWLQAVMDRTRKRSPAHCPCCTSRVVVKGINDLATKNPEVAKDWHPTKNGNLTPNMVTVQSDKLVWWHCPKCGKAWQAKVRSKRGCPHCLHRPTKGTNDLATLRPEIAQEWHPTKNENLTPQDVKVYSNKKVWWKCSVCNFEWQASANNRIGHQSGCPACAGRCARLGINDIFTINPELQKEWDYEANKDLDPKTLPQSSHTKVWWKCKQCNHKWQAEIRQRIKGSKCPYCHNIKVHQLKLF